MQGLTKVIRSVGRKDDKIPCALFFMFLSPLSSPAFQFLKKLIYLVSFFFFLALLGLPCCVWSFSSCGEPGLLFIVVASLVAEHRLWVHGLQYLQHMGHGLSCPPACGILPDHRSNPCLTALAGIFLSTVPPGKSCDLVLKYLDICCLGHFCESLLWSGPAQDLKSSLTSVFLRLFSLVLIYYLFIYWMISHTTLFLPCFLLYNFLCISFLSFPKPAFPSRTETLLCELVYFLLPRTEHVRWLV